MKIGQDAIWLYKVGDVVTFRVFVDDNARWSSSMTFTDGQWHHLAWRWLPFQFDLSLDGQIYGRIKHQGAPRTGSPPVPTIKFNEQAFSPFCEFAIDWVSIWTVARSEAFLESIYYMV